MKKLVAALLAATCSVSTAQAQTAGEDMQANQATPLFTLRDAMAAAGAMSPFNDVAEAGEQAAQANRRIAGMRPNPTFSLEAENVLGTGNYAGTQALETTGAVSWPIELGGKRSARIAVADAESGKAAIQSAILRADLRFAVEDAYIRAVAAESRLATAFDQSRIAAESRRAADIRVRAGRASPLEVQRADVERINADTALERAKRDVQVSRQRIGRLIGAPVPGGLDTGWFTQVPGGYGPLPEIDGAGTLALAAAEADLLTADAGLHFARSQRMPDLTAGIGARRLENGDSAFLFSVSVPLPIFNNGRAAVDQANALRRQAEALQRVAAIEVRNAIAEAQAEAANSAMSAAMATGPVLSAAKEAARIARIGYREGKFGQLDLLDAERTLAETQGAAIDALAAYHSARARFERLTTPAPVQGN